MLYEAQQARRFMSNKRRFDLDSDDLLAYAVVRAIEIVGEAAAHVSLETRMTYPQIPWHNIIGMRNRIVHKYNQVDLNIVWEVVDRNLPGLIVELEAILDKQ